MAYLMICPVLGAGCLSPEPPEAGKLMGPPPEKETPPRPRGRKPPAQVQWGGGEPVPPASCLLSSPPLALPPAQACGRGPLTARFHLPPRS